MDKNTSDSTIESTGVVIVGAGIAGLGAATKLEQSNFKDYILLEGLRFFYHINLKILAEILFKINFCKIE